MKSQANLPLVYSCSGASSAAQMANHIAVRLDRLGVAEMSCIAGVGGDVKPLVRTAQSGRPIIAIDGCPLQCAAQVLKRHGLQPHRHYDLSDAGVKKRAHEDFDPLEAARVLDRITRDLASEAASGPEPREAAEGSQPPPPEPFSPVCYLSEFKE
ncbi:MAG: putative zinc-binding protein [Verrucomicrobia bacterium]|jgi:uncharacterized metal-binding protein|nr:putative zinc-binding protein [Verrucomicrobiota bacterium]